MLVASQQPVESLGDVDRYHYLTETYQGTDFASMDVMKKGKRVVLIFQESWLEEYT